MILSDLTKALATPWVIVALAVFAVSTTILVVVALEIYLQRYRGPSHRLIQVRRMSLIAIGFSLIVSILIAYQGSRQIESDREYRSIHAVFSIQVSINGTITRTNISDPLTFRVSSGQYNVGCGDSREAIATWKVPEGAFDISANASWQGANNVKNLQQQVGPTQNVPEIRATGFMSGLDRNLFGDCPGGGHAEFVLSGTYRIRRSEVHGQQVLKTLDDKINRGQPLAVLIPHDETTTPQSCDINIEGENQRERIHLDLVSRPEGGFSFVNGASEHFMEGQIPGRAAIEGDHLLIRIL